jgi:signal transduction histidine kinase/CheY-like chemotaxis protein/HD-like signal output (HDOD) protein
VLSLEATRSHVLAEMPALPPLAREVLRAPEKLAARLETLSELADAHAEDAVHVMVEAARLYPKRPPRNFESAARRLGTRGVMRAVLRGLMPGLFPQSDSPEAIDIEAFWWQANLRATCAEHLAAQCHLPEGALGAAGLAEAAYPAAYLAQVGRIALERVPEPESSGSTVYLHLHTAQQSLDGEQRRYGVDHALAGKWMLEAWGMPTHWAEAVWLQYHPPGTLDHSSYPVALAELVGLAGSLTAAQFTGQQESFLEAAAPRAARLGISVSALRTAAYTDFEQWQPDIEPLDESGPASGAPILDTAELVSRLALAETIAHLYEATADITSETAALSEIVSALRETISCDAGLCVLHGAQGTVTNGVIWRGEEAPAPIPASTLDNASRNNGALRRLLDSFESNGPAWRTHDGAGMLALPLSDGQRVYGQVVLEVDSAHAGAAQVARLEQLMRAGAGILRRIETLRLTSRRQEEAGEAILKQEATHRRALRKARLDAVSRMAAGAAHEINNPLAVISGRAELLLSRTSDATQAQALETIVQQSRRVSRVISDLMQFARPEAPRFTPVSLSQLLHQVALQMQPRMAECNIRLVEDYATGIPLVEADRHQMAQVFTHLVTNAVQAMPDGGVLTLRVKAGLHTPSVMVQIIDTGCGILPEHMDHVFEPFFSGRPMGQAGTGLGLSVAHSIIERHLGTINLQSQMGEGCTCTLRFPASAITETPQHHAPEPGTPAPAPVLPFEAPPFAAEHQQAIPAAGASRASIVLCEPNEDAREVLQQTLEGRGYKVAAVHDGLEALASLFTGPADILLCDLHQPALDGQPLLRQVRERFPALGIVAFSNQLAAELTADPLRAFAYTVVQKPFHLETLFEALDDCLAPKRKAQ